MNIVFNDHNNVKLSAQYLINIYDKRSKIVTIKTTNDDQNIVLYHLLPHDQCPACTMYIYSRLVDKVTYLFS